MGKTKKQYKQQNTWIGKTYDRFSVTIKKTEQYEDRITHINPNYTKNGFAVAAIMEKLEREEGE